MKHDIPIFVVSRLLIGVLFMLTVVSVHAAGETIRLQSDSNSRLEIKDAIVKDDETTVLFWTWADRGDPGFREECSKNYYTVILRPGLPTARPRLMAEGACAGTGLLHGGLLDDGSGKFIVRDSLEHWKDGKQLSSTPVASIADVGTLQLNSVDMGSQFVDFNPAGDMVMAVMVSGYAAADWPGTPVVIAGLNPDNEKRWLLKIEESNAPITPEQIWAGSDGSALLRYLKVDMTVIAGGAETRLLHVSAAGVRSDLPLMKVVKPFDVRSMQPGSEEDLQKAFAHMEQNRPESIRSLAAKPRENGGFDLLFKRESDSSERNGYFLLRLDRDGAVQSETSLGLVIDEHGLEHWKDFYVTADQLVLLGSVMATQTGIDSHRKQWPQTTVSRIDLASLNVVSRLIPLDRQYLEAAMNAGDEGQQYLKGKPGGTPVLLTSLAGVPLALGQGWIGKRGTLRINEMTDDLVAFTEYRDQQQAKVARQERKQRSRKAGKAQLDQSMESALGMSAEAFEALSDEEKVMLMMQGGNMEALMQSVMKQTQAMQQGGGMVIPGTAMPESPGSTDQQAVVSKQDATFSIDALQRGHVRFNNAGGQAVMLSMINRQNGAELLKKSYPEGTIDEYFSLSGYNLPPGQIGVLIKTHNDHILADLSHEAQ